MTHDPEEMTHASRLDNGEWSSKLGGWIQTIHPRTGLEGKFYGDIVLHFKVGPGGKHIPGPLYSQDNVLASSTRVSAVIEQLATSFPKASKGFERRWEAWVASWSLPTKIMNQSESTFTSGPEWEALVNMGPDILPMVVDKLKDKSNVFGCYLCESLTRLSPSR